jgi:hypothetical protein
MIITEEKEIFEKKVNKKDKKAGKRNRELKTYRNLRKKRILHLEKEPIN